MTLRLWLLLVLGAAISVAYSVWWYRTREEPVAGRMWAAALRSAALVLILLILLNPSWPFDGRSGPEHVGLLDASYSMSLPAGPADSSLWRVALDSAASFERLWLFGGAAPSRVSRDSLPDGPVYSGSRLAPALRAAAREGARRATIYTDGGITDLSEAVREVQRSGLTISVLRLSADYPRLALAEIEAPDWVEIGDTAFVRTDIVAAAAELDSVGIELVDEAGTIRATGRVPVPGNGRFSSVRIPLPVTGAPGLRRYTVRLQDNAGDLEHREDERPLYLRAVERPRGPVLLSLRPDWEPSFLVPALDRVSESPASWYSMLGDQLIDVRRDYAIVEPTVVRRQADVTPLLVVHGFSDRAPEWARGMMQRSERLLVFPAAGAPIDVPGRDVRLSVPLPGEWYLTEEMPGSPLAAELTGLATEQLPPLVRIRRVDGATSWSPLSVQRARRGAAMPAVVTGTTRGRWAIATGEGYWRWAFRPGPGRQLYRALWTGLAGWLMEGRRPSGQLLEPREPAVPRGASIVWDRADDADSLNVRILARDDTLLWQGTTRRDSIGVGLPPGRYRYEARAYQAGSVSADGTGPVEVEEFTNELLPRAASLERLVRAAGDTTDDDDTLDEGDGRGLATVAWPYLLLILLLCAEWAVRRFIGLR